MIKIALRAGGAMAGSVSVALRTGDGRTGTIDSRGRRRCRRERALAHDVPTLLGRPARSYEQFVTNDDAALS